MRRGMRAGSTPNRVNCITVVAKAVADVITLQNAMATARRCYGAGDEVPGLARQPLKKLGSDEQALFQLLRRWRNEAVQAGHTIKRVVVAYEAGRDGFWLARWLRARDIEAYVIHANSVAVSREHRRAKTDRLDTELLKRAFLGWLRGEAGHCSMAAIPTIEEEDARRPNREREVLVGERTRIVNRMKATLARFGIRSFKFTLRHADERLNDLRTAEAASLPANTHAELRRDIARLRVVGDQIKEIEQQRLQRIKQAAPLEKGPHAITRLLARVIGIGWPPPGQRPRPHPSIQHARGHSFAGGQARHQCAVCIISSYGKLAPEKSTSVNRFRRTALCHASSDCVGHHGAALPQRPGRANRGVDGGLVLDFRIQFGTYQDDDRRKPHPHHQSDYCSQRPVGGRVICNMSKVP